MRGIDRLSPVPYYYQLQEALKQEIDAGSWRPGDLLPSEAELSEQFGISRTVIRQALDVLEADAQVRRVKGKGSFVAEPKLRYESAGAGDLVSAGRDLAAATISRVIEVQRSKAGDSLGALLTVESGRDVIEMTVVQSVHDVPVSLNRLFLRIDSSDAIESVVERGELPSLKVGESEILAQLALHYGVAVVRSDVTVEATLANKFETDLLGVEIRTPLFLLSSVVVGKDDATLGFMRSVVRCDYFRFSIRVDHSS
ncbi:MAG: GntR family transcriptional regulator [Acidobacteria bacterium]|nr:GntR family transcriptional regulator [Acidobacteriota bacterium]